MRILVINSGSSSVKFSVFDAEVEDATADPRLGYGGEFSGIGGPHPQLKTHEAFGPPPPASTAANAGTAADAVELIFSLAKRAGMPAVEAVGYRVVHPGPKLDRHQRITPEVLRDLEEARVFAPLHDPEVVAVIRQGMSLLPHVPHYACFDTVFHQTMPPEAITYPLPETCRQGGVRRYGFHGLSCESVVRQMRGMPQPLNAEAAFPKRMAIAHLGSGCSVTALVDGRSVDTSMGLTPTGGVVMGTRPGDLDPGLLLYLLRQQTGSGEDAVSAVETMLNHNAGIVALSGLPNDFKATREAAVGGDARCLLALKVFTRGVTKAIGGFHFLLGGLNAIVFAGGIGENDPLTREEILSAHETLGIGMDAALNRSHDKGPRCISPAASQTAVLVVPAQEELMIAVHVRDLHAAENHPEK